jgi:Rhs element Vgr protein
MAVKSPTDIDAPLLTVSVLISGTAVKDDYALVSVNITYDVNRIPHAELVYVDGDLDDGGFPISDGSDFLPGAEIEIKASYTSVPASIFKGYIVKQGVQINHSGPNNTVITCKHKAVAMTYNRMEEEFTAKADSDIITSIVGNYTGLSVTVDSTSVSQETMFQKLATDWDFILARAEFYGYIITFKGDAITVGKPKTDATAVLRIAQGDALRTFNAVVSAEKQAPTLSASAWDIKNQALLTAAASEPTVNAQGNLTAKTMSGKLGQTALTLNSCVPMVQAELKAWADGSLTRMRLSAIKGDVSFIGSELVLPGDIIELAGVGDRFNGNAFVTQVNHVIEEGDWTTYVKFGLDNIAISERPDFSYPATSGQLPAINGLQVATVKKLSGDPEDQFRIQVSLISNAKTQDGVWARMASFYATSGFGASFTPEVGDEVVVGFLESNPRYPVILGSLYSNARKNAAPSPDENNYIKTLSTKSNLKMTFDDDKKITKIVTPGGNSITLSDDAKSIELVDQNGNSIKMTSSGIDIKTGKDINLEATGNITLKATGKVNLTATQDAVITGMNVSATAQMGFTGKGSATAEVSASGQTTIKGGIVMIN